jgi:hypothetical protein
MTRDTVAWETPALTATSAMPILPVADLLTIVVPSLARRPEALRVLLPCTLRVEAGRAAFSRRRIDSQHITPWESDFYRFPSFSRKLPPFQALLQERRTGKRFLPVLIMVDGYPFGLVQI